jgi:hypothetical protein
MPQTPDLEAAMARVIEDLYPIDATTGLRIYNPDGQRVVDITELVEITHAETHSDCCADRSGSTEGGGAGDEAPEDHAERTRGDGAACAGGEARAGTAVEGPPEGAAVRDRDLTHRLEPLARKLNRLSHATTRLRRSITADAQLLVELEGALDAVVRLLRLLSRRREERR